MSSEHSLPSTTNWATASSNLFTKMPCVSRWVKPASRFLDLVVANRIILEIKAITALGNAQEAQLLNYLKASKLEVGLLLNFGPKAEFKRKVLSAKNPRPSAPSA